MTLSAYEILGVADDATPEEIHHAYRRLARRLHPDAGGNDAVEMARVNAAWRTLGDPARRATYDTARACTEAPSPPWTPFEATASGDVRIQRALRAAVVAAALLMLVVFVAAVLIGFGRIGVSAQP